MPPSGKARAEVVALWRRAAEEQQRAARAADLAARYEHDAELVPAARRTLRLRMAALHRQTEARHRIAARLQSLHAMRLQKWIDDANNTVQPPFIAAVATALDVRSTALTMLGPRGSEAVVTASDLTARAAHDLEFVIGEGPGRDAIRAAKPVIARGAAFQERWPEFSRAVTDIGVHAVLAVPLLLPAACVGALCVYDQADIREDAAAATEQVAEALVRAVFAPSGGPGEHEVPGLTLVDETDYSSIVHQAAGMVSVDCGCSIDDAMALLRARAFAEGRTAGQIATLVVRDGIRLR